MGQVGDLIGAERAAAAGVLRKTEHPRLEEGAIDDQLPTALEQVKQANLALGSVERVPLLHGHPRHPSTLGGQRVSSAGQCLLLHEELLARSLPLPRRHDPGFVLWKIPFRLLHVFLPTFPERGTLAVMRSRPCRAGLITPCSARHGTR